MTGEIETIAFEKRPIETSCSAICVPDRPLQPFILQQGQKKSTYEEITILMGKAPDKKIQLPKWKKTHE